MDGLCCLFWHVIEIKLQVIRPATLLKGESNTCFPVNIAKFLITPVLKNMCIWLLLKIIKKFLGKATAHNDHYMISMSDQRLKVDGN